MQTEKVFGEKSGFSLMHARHNKKGIVETTAAISKFNRISFFQDVNNVVETKITYCQNRGENIADSIS